MTAQAGYCHIAAPDPVSAPDRGRWHGLYSRFHEQPYPLLVAGDTTVPAATLWAGARLWVQAFRAAGVVRGDRVLLVLLPSAPFVQVLLAALWEGLTLVPVAPVSSAADLASLIEETDASLAVWNGDGGAAWQPDSIAGPGPDRPLRPTRHAPTPDARFLLRSSGTGGAARWVALSDENIWAVLDSHLPLMGLREGVSRVVSVLPWHHAFGLVLDLLPALLCGAEIWRDPHGGRDPQSLLTLAHSAGATHLSAVPLVLQRLLQTPGGKALIDGLDGGIVGGATVDAPLAAALRGTRLRVGYGQTEASPGIALGGRGVFPGPGYMGRAVGCRVNVVESK